MSDGDAGTTGQQGARATVAPPAGLQDLGERVQAVGEKYGYDAAHAAQVANLAGGLFSALAPVHGLAPEWRFPLEHAALLHDIGYFVHARRHHRHSRYLIRRDALLDDYPQPWRDLVALVAGNHRRRPRSAPRAWGRSTAAAAAALSAILRLADGLDYGHDAAARLMGVHVRRGHLEVAVSGLRLPSLQPVLRKKANLFARTFALPVAFVPAAGAGDRTDGEPVGRAR
jgi:exopolyphosphatase/guanosine-5'-triphosphate,3'-diphosphate pyrophosphatase